MDNNLREKMIVEIEWAFRCWKKDRALELLREYELIDFLQTSTTFTENEEYRLLGKKSIARSDKEDERFQQLKIFLEEKFTQDNPKNWKTRTCPHEKLQAAFKKLKEKAEDIKIVDLRALSQTSPRRSKQGREVFTDQYISDVDVEEYFLVLFDAEIAAQRDILLNHLLKKKDIYGRGVKNIPPQHVHAAMRIETRSKYKLEDYLLVTKLQYHDFSELSKIVEAVLNISKKQKGDWFDWMTALHFWNLRYGQIEHFVDFTKTLCVLYETNKISYNQFSGLLRYVCDVHSVSQLSSLNVEMVRHLRDQSDTFESLICNIAVKV